MASLFEISPISWFYYSDPVSAKVPMISGSPIPVILFSIVYLAFAFYFGPKWMSTRQAYDLRPYMLISNALIFGAVGAGIPLSLWLSSWGRIPWMCPEPAIKPMLLETQIYLGVAFFWIQIFSTTTTLFMILRKKSNQSPAADALRNVGIIFLVYFGSRMHPRGPFLFRPVCEITIATFRRAYYILLAPGHLSRPYSMLKSLIICLTWLSAILNTFHVSYLFRNECSGVTGLKIAALVTTIAELIYLTFQVIRRKVTSKKID